MKIEQIGNRLVMKDGASQIWIDAWGVNSFRVRMTCEPKMDENDWALAEEPIVPEGVMITPKVSYEQVDTTDPWYKGDEYKKYHQTGTVTTFKMGT